MTTAAPVWQRAVATYEQLSGWAEQALPEAHASLAPPASSETWSDRAHDVIDGIAAKKDGVHDWPRGMSVDEVDLLPLRFLAARGDGQQLWIDVHAAGNGALNVEAIQGLAAAVIALAAASKTDRRRRAQPPSRGTLGLAEGGGLRPPRQHEAAAAQAVLVGCAARAPRRARTSRRSWPSAPQVDQRVGEPDRREARG